MVQRGQRRFRVEHAGAMLVEEPKKGVWSTRPRMRADGEGVRVLGVEPAYMMTAERGTGMLPSMGRPESTEVDSALRQDAPEGEASR